jgi:superfamily II DNA or RNA helicase/HKD family nuclease
MGNEEGKTDNFITNSSTKKLKKRLLELLPKSRELKFLVGFFYFSGLKELYEGLKDNPNTTLKILVGLNVDRTNYGLIECGESTNNLSDDEKIYNFFQSIRNSINTEYFDQKEFYEQVRFFIECIRNGKLIIRKTYQPNHAKLYIFKLEEEQVGRDALFITGSSNLTSSGLTLQDEFNVEISDYGFEDAEAYFDNLWGNAVQITEDNEVRKRLVEVLEKETLIKEITPFEAYAYVLRTYLDTFEGKSLSQRVKDILSENGYKIYNYQLDAVSQALSIIEQNNGVIIADVVGLGKTIIACAVAFELRKRGIVIAPPGLIGDKGKKSGWRKYLEDFHLTSLGWEAYSLGDLETVLDLVSKAKDIDVVIIDEAHRFRNQDTESYELLRNICRDKIVILLTATPFNNRPSDIFSLLKLFVIPKKSNISLSDDLEGEFTIFKNTFDKLAYIKRYSNSQDSKKRSRALRYYKSIFGKDTVNLQDVKTLSRYLAKEIRDAIEPVTIRRNRLDLQQNPYYKDEIKELSKIEDPEEWFFELTKEQSEFYDEVINKYFDGSENDESFKGAIYKPFIYEKGKIIDLLEADLTKEENFQYQRQANLYDFMRRLLVKRFESSFGAFEQSLRNFERITDTVLQFINKTGKYILDRSLLDKIYDKDIDEIEEYLKEYAETIKEGRYPKEHKVYEIERFKEKDKFLEDIKADLSLFRKLLNRLQELDLTHNDPKVKCLITKLKGIINSIPKKDEPKRRAVIFSEYIDTVKYLAPILNKEFNNRVLVVAGDLSSSKITEIYKNFDASYKEQDDDYDILLSTDKISEGFNLNRAGIVINYDIPWNPVRVIQRVGRVNRISKKVFSKLYIVNFFPTEKGSDIVKSRDIASSKMFLIHNALGEDSKIFDIDEEPSPSELYRRIQRNPDLIEEESFYTKVLKEFEEIKKENPELVKAFNNYPPRIKVAKKGEEDELITVLKKKRLFILYKKYSNTEPLILQSLEEVLDKIKATKDEKRLPLSGYFWDTYEEIKSFRDNIINHITEQSLQQRAMNVIKSLLSNSSEGLIPYKNFIRMLLEDIRDYGTLSDYTLRRITNLELEDLEHTIREITGLKKELGEDYLYREKERIKSMKREVIIAIENRKL